jgi:hypothetical protein
LVDPKLEENVFTFKIPVNEKCMVEAKLRIEGKKFNGTFTCASASGTLKGTKRL